MKAKDLKEMEKAGDFIRKYRKENNYSIEELAEKCDLSDRCISDIERGTRIPKANTLLNICRVLKINIGELFALYPRIDEDE